MDDQKTKDLFNQRRFRTDLKNSEFLFKLCTFINSKNPFIKASGNNEIDDFFLEGWKRFISKYNYCFKKFNLLNEHTKFQLFIISAFSQKSFLYCFIKDHFKVNTDAYKVYTPDPLSSFYYYKIYKTDEFKIAWFELVKNGFPDKLKRLYWDDFHKIIYEVTKTDPWQEGFGSEFFRHDYHDTEYCIQPYSISSKNINNYLSEFIRLSKNKKNLISSYSWAYWKSFDFVKTIADHDLDLLKLGPPSFHKNKSLIKQLLASHPSYYFKMRSRNLKKDKGITKAAITADPSLINKIPRQYVENINPFILAQGGDIQTKKYTTELKGIVCITGKTISVDTKQEATYLLEDNGYVVSKTLTKECNYLLNETGGKTSKSNKIKKYPYLHITEIKKLSDLLEKN